MEDLVRVEDLSVSYLSAGQRFLALKRASFSIHAGEVVGIVGESGSGKTTLALALARMLPVGARYEGGTLNFRGVNLLQMTEKQLAAIWGAQIAIIWQDPALALNPVMRVGTQIAEVLRSHGLRQGSEREGRVRELLEEVGLERAA